MKRCKMCGLLKDDEDFRVYTHAKERNDSGMARYSVCRSCEALTTRYNYLRKKLNITDEVNSHCIIRAGEEECLAEYKELVNLFELLEDKGMHTPLSRRQRGAMTSDGSIAKLKNFYEAPAKTTTVVATAVPTALSVDSKAPSELQEWLNQSMDDWRNADLSPEYLQETVYESLKAKYRPQIGLDTATYTPIYDDTYKEVLQAILRKFDDYEDAEAEVDAQKEAESID